VNFDLLVSIVERAEGPRLQMEYNTVIFRSERIVRPDRNCMSACWKR